MPFFLQNTPARVQGIGEKIIPIENFLKNYSILIICPPIHIASKWAYEAFDAAQKNIFLPQHLTNFAHKDKHTFSCALNEVSKLGNDFEDVIFEVHPMLAKIKNTLLSAGAKIAVMSGSGSSMIGIFENTEKANVAALMHKDCRVYTTTL